MSDFEFKTYLHGHSITVPCGICGADIDSSGFSLRIIDKTGEAVIEDVCMDCITGGPKGAASNARMAAAIFRHLADYQDRLAERIQAIPEEEWLDRETYLQQRDEAWKKALVEVP